MVATSATKAEEQAAAREVLATVVAAATERVLATWEDDRLLGQLRAKIVAQVKRDVRVELAHAAPHLMARSTPSRLRRPLDEIVPRAIGRAQAGALRRRMEAEGQVPIEFEFAPGEGIVGVTVIQVGVPVAESTD